MPDVWAHCPECDRWFYPEETVDAVDPLAPAALAKPSTIDLSGSDAHLTGSPGSTTAATGADPHGGDVSGQLADGERPTARCPVCSVRADRLLDRAGTDGSDDTAMVTPATG